MSENKSLIPYEYHTITVYRQDRYPIEDRGPRILKGCLTAFVLFLCISILIFLVVIITDPTEWKNKDDKNTSIPSLPADPSAGERYLLKLDGTEFAFRWCPPGEFMMGSPREESNRENEHQHKVTLSQGFWLLETEVTQEMWKKVMDSNPSEFKNDQNPVENVSWDDCQTFCQKLTEKIQEKLAKQKQVPPVKLPPIQLPTEAQWEYACRAGTTGPHAGELGQMAWFNDNSGAHPHEVRKMKQNAWGLFDMHGNVFEWCTDWYDANFYDKSPANDPENTAAAEARVYRGGGWRSSANDCSSAYRCWNPQNLAENNRGLRVLMVPGQVTNKITDIPPLPSNPSAGSQYKFTLEGTDYIFRWCPPGEFMMGSPDDEKDLADPERKHRDDEKQHSVSLTQGFWILETEVTQEMWKSVMGTSPGKFLGERNPVEQVSWNDCQEFCKKLSEKLKTLNVTIQLPTEAQWEYACRAGSSGKIYGNPDDIMWYASNSGAMTHAAAQKKPNSWGLYDMHGNVWEWCSDWYDEKYYNKSPKTDPNNTNASRTRVLRGACWNDSADHCRAAIRYNNTPESRDSNFGFRVLFTAKAVSSPPSPPRPESKIEPVQSAKFEIVSYKLVPPQKRVSPRFYIYKLQDGKVVGDRQRTWWVHNGNLSAKGAIPKSNKYPVWIRREGNITYRWNTEKTEGGNDYIVVNATISAEDICKESDTSNNNPFWITLSDGNKIQMRFIKRDGTAYQFIITSYKILNPKYTYDISFRVRNGGNEIYSKTQNGSRTHELNATGMGTFEVKKQEGNYVLEVFCRSGNHGSVTHQININDVIDRLNQEMETNPNQKEWTVPVTQDDNQIILKYTKP